MNIRPISTTPKAVAFAGTKTKEIKRETNKPTSEAVDQDALIKLLGLEKKQIVSVVVKPDDNLVAIELSPNRRGNGKMSFVKIPITNHGDTNSPPVSIDYLTRTTKSGSRITESHTISIASKNAETKIIAADAVNYLISIARNWMTNHRIPRG